MATRRPRLPKAYGERVQTAIDDGKFFLAKERLVKTKKDPVGTIKLTISPAVMNAETVLKHFKEDKNFVVLGDLLIMGNAELVRRYLLGPGQVPAADVESAFANAVTLSNVVVAGGLHPVILGYKAVDDLRREAARGERMAEEAKRAATAAAAGVERVPSRRRVPLSKTEATALAEGKAVVTARVPRQRISRRPGARGTSAGPRDLAGAVRKAIEKTQAGEKYVVNVSAIDATGAGYKSGKMTAANSSFVGVPGIPVVSNNAAAFDLAMTLLSNVPEFNMYRQYVGQWRSKASAGLAAAKRAGSQGGLAAVAARVPSPRRSPAAMARVSSPRRISPGRLPVSVAAAVPAATVPATALLRRSPASAAAASPISRSSLRSPPRASPLLPAATTRVAGSPASRSS